MPVGINFMCRAFEEKKLYEIASEFEKIAGLDGLTLVNRKEGNL